ncbi:peritrophin-48 [Drosophila rhopaloa]|uniref:Chitin-binding type-2 domain-containing protein n=1 Tax=Drosophila rhopaloa TaxID=1041015 RepID=A0ABM5JFB8_DRORH|nr:peritrophin-48 [Drosophila rhopaloa]
MIRASGILSLLLVASALGDVIDDFEYLSVGEMCDLLPQETSFLRPSTCDSWVTCAGNYSVLEQGGCAAGLTYNKELGRCAQASGAVCPYTGNIAVQPKNLCANESDGAFVEDPSSSDCRGYVLCRNQRQIKANCPNELIFHPKSRSCVYQNQYECPTSQTKKTSPACRPLSNNTRLADPVHCDQYLECVDEVLHSRSCPVQEAYDADLGVCVPVERVNCYETAALPEPENTFCLDNVTGKARTGYLADDLSCSQYYICGKPIGEKHDTEPKHLSCPQGQYFDFEKLSCRDRLNVRCQLDRCVGTNLTYVNVAGDCQSYGRCSGGITVSLGHCPEGYFFDERNQGCSQTNYHYIACSA